MILACVAALLLLTPLIDYRALRALDRVVSLLRWHSHIPLVMGRLFRAHAIELVLHAAAYVLLIRHAALPSIGRQAPLPLNLALHCSCETFSTLGDGDIARAGVIRLLAGSDRPADCC